MLLNDNIVGKYILNVSSIPQSHICMGMYSFITFATEHPTSRHLSHGLASNKQCSLLLVGTSLNPFIPNTVPPKKKITRKFKFLSGKSYEIVLCKNSARMV